MAVKKAQKGFSQNSIVVCSHIFAYHDIATRDKLIDFFTEKIGPYAYEKNSGFK